MRLWRALFDLPAGGLAHLPGDGSALVVGSRPHRFSGRPLRAPSPPRPLPDQLAAHCWLLAIIGCCVGPAISVPSALLVAVGVCCARFGFGALRWEVVVAGLSARLPVVGFAGPRVAPAGSGPLVASLVAASLAAGRAVAAGCAAGVDSQAVAAAVAAGAGVGPLAPRLFVFALFGPLGLGSLSTSAVAGVQAALLQGARVAWWAGGRSARPAARLAARSLAFVHFLAAAPAGSGLVVVAAGPPPRAFAQVAPGRWPSCGSGSWGSAGAAALLGLPVVVFPLGWAGFVGPASLPLLPGRAGRWLPAGSGLWSAGWRWVV